jgi:hypothetical protein
VLCHAALSALSAADKTISVEDGRKFAAALPGHRLVEVEGADHNFTGVLYLHFPPWTGGGGEGGASWGTERIGGGM